MADYDNIAIPIKGQPVSVGTYGVPVRDAILDLARRMAIREAAEDLPAAVSAANSSNTTGTFSTAAATWAALSVNPISCAISNPSTAFDLLCNVHFGAWMSIAATAQVRLGVALTGGVTASPSGGPGPNQPVGWGLFPETSSVALDGHTGFFQVIIPAGTVTPVTFTIQGYRSVANAAVIQYPTIYVVPDRYQLP